MPTDRPSLEDSYDAFPRIEEEFGVALDESLSPRGPEALYDVVAALRLPAGARAVDVGCGEGAHAIELARRFGFEVLGVDPIERHVSLARQAFAQASLARPVGAVRFSTGTAEHTPVADGSVDLLWCREVLMYVDLPAALAEAHRVLRPGGRGIVHQVLTGPLMGDDEARTFWSDLGAPASSLRPEQVEAALALAGLPVHTRIDFGSEWGERAEEQDGAGTRRLLHAARLLREPDRYTSRFGEAAYRIMLGDCLWHVYRMIGKLTGCTIVFGKPLP